jgi:sterol O-acyltransferase
VLMNSECVVALRPLTSDSRGSRPTTYLQGFFSLFWISLFLFTLQTYIRGLETTGQPLPMAFARMFSRDARTLALSDAVMVATTGLCVPFVKIISKRWIRYYWTGFILQMIFQSIYLSVTVTWTFNRRVWFLAIRPLMLTLTVRHWPWVQSGFLTLHCLVRCILIVETFL